MPTPMPAPNIMDNQVNRENSGVSPGLPSISRPVLGHSAKARQARVKKAVTSMYQCAKDAVDQLCSASSCAPAAAGDEATQINRAAMMIFGTAATHGLNPA